MTEDYKNILILKLLFKGFSYPSESRFAKENSNNNIQMNICPYTSMFTSKKTTTKKNLIIKPIDIINGIDKRTSIIIKNLPMKICKDELKNIIEPLGNINFIYIPLLIKNKNRFSNNLPCAYVNVINYKTILNIMEIFQNLKHKKFEGRDFSKVEIFYSGTQGKYALINRFSLEKKYLPPNQSISFS